MMIDSHCDGCHAHFQIDQLVGNEHGHFCTACRAMDHTYTGTLDVNGEPSPFTGLGCRIVERHGMDMMGFTAIIELDVTAEALADRYNAANASHQGGFSGTLTVADMVEFHTYPDHPGIIIVECNADDDITER
jgi:hypothetical protein